MKRSDKEILQALKEHVDILRKYRVKRIGLFGSYARKEQKPQSDIDLLVEFDLSGFDENFTGYLKNYLGLLSELGEIFATKVDLVTDDMISPYIKPHMTHDLHYIDAA